MMKKYILFTILICLLGTLSHSQELSTMSHYVCSNGWDIKEGDTLTLLRPRDSFFISFSDKRPGKNAEMLPASKAGEYGIITSMEKLTWNDGYKQYFAKVRIGKDKYYVNLEQAIYKDEIQVPTAFPKNPNYSPERVNSEGSTIRLLALEKRIDSIPLKDGKIFYDEIVEFPGKSKDEIFILLRNAMVETFNDSKYVLEVNDIQNGRLTGKATSYYIASKGLTSTQGYVTFIISMAVKDGKFRYQLYSFVANGTKSQINLFINETIRSEESFPMELALDRYKRGDKKASALAKQELTSMIASVDLFRFRIKKACKEDSNDISKF